MATPVGKVLSVNVGGVRQFEYNARPAKSAIWKSPVVGRIAARGVNLAGDDQADRKAHGGPDKALYAYAVEDARWWEQEIGRAHLTTKRSHGERLAVQPLRSLSKFRCSHYYVYRPIGTVQALAHHAEAPSRFIGACPAIGATTAHPVWLQSPPRPLRLADALTWSA
jgi:hypothetical protein